MSRHVAILFAACLFTFPVSAADQTAADGAVQDNSGGYATDATDRGGRPSSSSDTDSGAAEAFLAWLKGSLR
ncbi:MAG: hypothetical protein AAF610_02880 [Pseudomonadota bacterium]